MTTTMDACDELRSAVQTAVRPASSVVNQVIHAQRALPAAGENIIEVMRATIDMILATEAAASAFEEATKAARAALAASMADTGAGNISTVTHTAGLRRVPTKAIVTGPVPSEYMTVPEPRPDLAKIKKALANGPLSFAALSNGGAEILAITTRGQK